MTSKRVAVTRSEVQNYIADAISGMNIFNIADKHRVSYSRVNNVLTYYCGGIAAARAGKRKRRLPGGRTVDVRGYEAIREYAITADKLTFTKTPVVPVKTGVVQSAIVLLKRFVRLGA